MLSELPRPTKARILGNAENPKREIRVTRYYSMLGMTAILETRTIGCGAYGKHGMQESQDLTF